MENSLYNVLLAAQVGDIGYHYLNYLQRTKDWRYLDPATCCAAMGTRLCALLPQFLYTYTQDMVSCDIYASSEASLPNGVRLRVETDMPDGGRVCVHILEAQRPFCLRLRIPRWAGEGSSRYEIYQQVRAGAKFTLDFAMPLQMHRYSGGEEIPGKTRWALTRGPLPGPKNCLRLRGDDAHSYMAYLDIHDEPFDVYPIVEASGGKEEALY